MYINLNKEGQRNVSKITLKSLVSPIVSFTFVTLSITGILMLFDIGEIEELHEFLGIAFVVVGTIHLIINWQVLVTYCRGRKVVVLGTVILIMITVLLLGFEDNDPDIDNDSNTELIEHVKSVHKE